MYIHTCIYIYIYIYVCMCVYIYIYIHSLSCPRKGQEIQTQRSEAKEAIGDKVFHTCCLFSGHICFTFLFLILFSFSVFFFVLSFLFFSYFLKCVSHLSHICFTSASNTQQHVSRMLGIFHIGVFS